MSIVKGCYYRYYGKEKHILDVLKLRHIFCNLCTKFNDPFDCRPPFSFRRNKCHDDRIWQKFRYCLYRIESPDADRELLWKKAETDLLQGLHKE
jgi:hypothetical protein